MPRLIPDNPRLVLDEPRLVPDKDASFKDMSKFMKVIDIISRPGYAVKSSLSELEQQVPHLTFKGGVGIDQPTKPFDPTEILKAGGKGMSGKERLTANELLSRIGIHGIPGAGFTAEVASDPLMWFGGAGYKAITKGVGKGVKTVGKGVKSIPIIERALGIVTEKAQPVTTALRNMFVTKSGFKKFNDLIETHLTKREYLRGKELLYAKKVRNIIQNVSRKSGQSVDDIEKQLIGLIEQPGIAPSSAPGELRALANTMKSHLSNMLTKEMKAGVPITHLAKGNRGIEYFPRITVQEAKKYLKQARVGNAKVWNPRLANALQRKTMDFTLAEFNDFVASHGLKSLGGRSVEQFFLKKPAAALYIRGSRSAKAITSAQFLDDVGRQFGQRQAPSYWEELPNAITRLNPRLRGLKFDPEIAEEIGRTTAQYFNPKETGVFLKGYDFVQNAWKKWTLAPFPKYHLRNMVGNLWNNHLAGVQLSQYPRAQALQMYRKYGNKGGKMGKYAIAELDKIGISPQQADDFIRWAEQTGVLGQGWYAADVETAVEQALKGSKGLIGRGMAFGTTIENNARLAHFLDRLDKGDDILGAAQSVKKFLFDYTDLTAFEKQVVKRLMPFYTWTRKNVPLQLQQIWEKPQKFAPLGIPLRQRDPKDLLRLKYSSPQLYERLPIELQRDIDTVTYIPLEGLLPAGDLAKMVRPQEMFLELITPYLRAPIELRMNKSFYFESEIQRYDNQTQELLRMDIPVKLKYTLTTVLPQARMLNELNKLVKKQVRKEKLTVGEQAFAQSLSSVYKMNLNDLKVRAVKRIKRKISDLKRGAYWAKVYDRKQELKRIEQTIKEVAKEIGEVR